MGNRFTKLTDGTWQCNRCGKIVQDQGWLGHWKIHVKERKNQTVLSKKVQNFNHKGTCKCGDCESRRRLTGQ